MFKFQSFFFTQEVKHLVDIDLKEQKPHCTFWKSSAPFSVQYPQKDTLLSKWNHCAIMNTRITCQEERRKWQHDSVFQWLIISEERMHFYSSPCLSSSLSVFQGRTHLECPHMPVRMSTKDFLGSNGVASTGRKDCPPSCSISLHSP